MYPILTRLPYAFLYSYTAVLGLGVLGVVAWSWWRARPEVAGWLDGLLAAGVGAILGGRVAFVLGNLGYFAENNTAVWRIGQGGLGYYGALGGGLLALGMWCWWGKRPLTPYLDFWAMPLILLHAAGWGACYLEGCAYGRATWQAWYTAALPDAFGVWAVRYPVQVWGVGLCLLVWGVVWWRKRRPSGWESLAAINLIHSALTFWRGDPMPLWGDYRADMVLGLGAGLLFILLAHRLPPTAEVTSQITGG